MSFLIALVSFCVIVGIGAQPRSHLDVMFEGPVFRAGVYVGAIIFPHYATRGTNGFYLVPLFGAAADFLLLMTCWFIAIQVFRRLRAARHSAQHP